MKKDIHHKDYRYVVFEDLNDGAQFLTRSTVATDEITKYKKDGKDYPVVKVHISSSSHPFYTGQEKLVDIEGRVDKFEARRKAAEAAKESRQKAAAKVRAKTEPKAKKLQDKDAVAN